MKPLLIASRPSWTNHALQQSSRAVGLPFDSRIQFIKQDFSKQIVIDYPGQV